jgi:hypothetical protein
LGGFTHRWKSWFWVGKLSLKLMRVKDLIKKHKKVTAFFKSTRGYFADGRKEKKQKKRR